MNKKVQLGVIGVSIFGVVLYLNGFIPHMSTNVDVQKKLPSEEAISKSVNRRIESDNHAIAIRIKTLQQQIEDISNKALNVGGLSEPRIFNYEGEWCIASQDLSEKDQIYLQSQRKEWLDKNTANELVVENNKLLKADMLNYLDMDADTLKSYAQRDDVTALRMLAKQINVKTDEETIYQASRRLLVLGEWKDSIQVLVGRHLFEAKLEIEANSNEARTQALLALSYVELGFQHASLSALYTLQRMLDSNLKLKALIANIEEEAVLEKVQQLKSNIDEKRLTIGLERLNEIEIPRIAFSQFQDTLILMRQRHEGIRILFDDAELLPKYWKTQYLDTPCIKRQIATREAKFHQLPAIRAEIAQLQSQLEELNNSQ